MSGDAHAPRAADGAPQSPKGPTVPQKDPAGWPMPELNYEGRSWGNLLLRLALLALAAPVVVVFGILTGVLRPEDIF